MGGDATEASRGGSEGEPETGDDGCSMFHRCPLSIKNEAII